MQEFEENNIYEPDEIGKTRFNIILCELYNEKVHGITNTNELFHYLVHCRYKVLDMNCINELSNYIQEYYMCLPNKRHTIFRNYRNIIMNNYIKPEIGECIYLDTGHCVAILKTFWIKIIQRTWKNIIKNRKNIIIKRSNPIYLKYKETKGIWPDDCLHFPKLKGMLLLK